MDLPRSAFGQTHMTTSNERPYVAITMGDAAGIGAEVVVKALADDSIYERCRPFVIGNADAVEHAIEISGLDASILAVSRFDQLVGRRGVIEVLDAGNLEYSCIAMGQLSASAGRAAVEWALTAGRLASEGLAQAVVTAPINKEAARMAGHNDIGHMEIFQVKRDRRK